METGTNIKKRWYRSVFSKGLLITLSQIAVLCIVLFFIMIGRTRMVYFQNEDILAGPQKFEESASFEHILGFATRQVTEQIATAHFFEVDGVYDPERLVDILYFARSHQICSENVSGVSYRLGDLRSWARIREERMHWGDYHDFFQDVVVAIRPDGSFYYYQAWEFVNQLRRGEFIIPFMEINERLFEWMNREMFSDSVNVLDWGLEAQGGRVFDAENNLLYIGFRDMIIISEIYSPIGATNLIDLVNENPELNGRLWEINDSLEIVLQEIGWRQNVNFRWVWHDQWGNEHWGGRHVFTEWTEGNTNFIYLYVNERNGIIRSNREEFRDPTRIQESIEEIRSNPNIGYFIARESLADFETNLNISPLFGRHNIITFNIGIEGWGGTFIGAVDLTTPIPDVFQEARQEFERLIPIFRIVTMLAIGSVVIVLITLIWLTAVAGKNNKAEGVQLVWFDRWKTEIAAALVFLPWLFVTIFVWNNIRFNWQWHFLEYALAISYVILSWMLFLVGYLSLVRRIKGKTIWYDSLLYWLWKVGIEFWNNRTVIWRGIILVLGFIGVHWLAVVGRSYAFFILLMLVVDVVALCYVIKHAIGRHQIKKGIQEIAGGNLSYQIPLDSLGLRSFGRDNLGIPNLGGETYKMAVLVNSIGSGLQAAVEESMRSERMKTDLITNVSHDIKTPLTSIINYVELLKRENFKDEKVQGYIKILEEKAQRLKNLTEDVVEASKVSSGNITLERMNINLAEMLHQAEGEFEERFMAKRLSLVSRIPEEPVVIHVDGKRMWRVIENIFNNVEKYAMPGSRVYGDLIRTKKTIVYSLKNVSEQPLNITAEELTERFIRGDEARTTEGSGLGLSIAKSLTELQGGSFRLYIDGDLFKVIIEFPEVEKPCES